MLLWPLVVRWEEGCFNVSILKRYHLSLVTASFFYTHKTTNETADPYSPILTSSKVGVMLKRFEPRRNSSSEVFVRYRLSSYKDETRRREKESDLISMA